MGGYGSRFWDWVEEGKSGKRLVPYYSCGNGSAMRIAPVGWLSSKVPFRSEKLVLDYSKKSAECTHNHPEGIKGAVVTATCIWMAKHGKGKQEIYDYVLAQYPVSDYEYSIGYSLDEIRPRYKWNESCQGSVPAAMRCFYESSDYESFIRNIYSLPCDSDTFGAIAGGVAEEFYGGFGGVDAEGIIKKQLDDYLYEILMK